MSNKPVTCGVIILDDQNKLFIGHATGQNHWDIPKGVGDLNESYVETAIRELQEETGFNVSKEQLKDLGLFQYNKKKDLKLFLLDNFGKTGFEANNAICTSYFENHKGIQLPEMDQFKYIELRNIDHYLSKSMARVLNVIFTFFDS